MPPLRKRSMNRGTPAAGSATQADCAAVSTMLSASNHTGPSTVYPARHPASARSAARSRGGGRDSHPDLGAAPPQGRCRRRGRRPRESWERGRRSHRYTRVLGSAARDLRTFGGV